MPADCGTLSDALFAPETPAGRKLPLIARCVHPHQKRRQCSALKTAMTASGATADGDANRPGSYSALHAELYYHADAKH